MLEVFAEEEVGPATVDHTLVVPAEHVVGRGGKRGVRDTDLLDDVQVALGNKVEYMRLEERRQQRQHDVDPQASCVEHVGDVMVVAPVGVDVLGRGDEVANDLASDSSRTSRTSRSSSSFFCNFFCWRWWSTSTFLRSRTRCIESWLRLCRMSICTGMTLRGLRLVDEGDGGGDALLLQFRLPVELMSSTSMLLLLASKGEFRLTAAAGAPLGAEDEAGDPELVLFAPSMPLLSIFELTPCHLTATLVASRMRTSCATSQGSTTPPSPRFRRR